MPKLVPRFSWFVLFEAAVRMRSHWRRLPPPDRARLTELVRRSGGRPHHLSREERAEFRRIVGGLDLTGIARDMAPFGRRLRGRH
jgi:hypothetical protein